MTRALKRPLLFRRRISGLTLILVNLIPLWGVYALGWSVYSLLLVYWLESFVVGAYYLIKLFRLPRGTWRGYLASTAFFLFTFGMPWLVHGLAIQMFFNPDRGPYNSVMPWDLLSFNFYSSLGPSHRLAIFSLGVSHGLSFWLHFLGNKEYLYLDATALIKQPFARVLVLHLSVLIGGFAVMELKMPSLALLVLVLAKIILDLRAHLNAHRR